MEICYLVKGEIAFNVGGQDYKMEGNDVFWTHADEPHSSGPNPYGKSLLYWLQIYLPSKPVSFLTLSKESARPLVTALRSLPRRHFPGDLRLKTIFEDAFRLCEQPRTPLRRLGLALRLAEWLRTAAECGMRGVVPEISDDIQNALDLVRNQAAEPLSPREMAAAAHLSESRFKAKFRAQVGMPPGEYVLRRRIATAETLLREGKLSVTEIAHRLNFSSSQYFANVFRRFTLKRPTDVKNHLDNSADKASKKAPKRS
jgi:AraC-like DNA-binding protein